MFYKGAVGKGERHTDWFTSQGYLPPQTCEGETSFAPPQGEYLHLLEDVRVVVLLQNVGKAESARGGEQRGVISTEW